MISVQTELELVDNEATSQVKTGGYIYRVIATNRAYWSGNQIIHWYNQLGVWLPSVTQPPDSARSLT